MITEIKSEKKVFALIADFKDLGEGTFPITNPRCTLQMLMMKRNKGYVVKKHMHKKIPKHTKQPQEAVVLIKGELDAVMFNRKGKIIGQSKVKAGQCLFIFDGGLEVKITKKCLLFEFKNGPYIEDKVWL